MTYALRAARLHLIGRYAFVLWPWAIMASSLVINYVIFAALQANGQDSDFTGGLLSLYIVQFIVFSQLFTRGFQSAMNLSMTRRAYYSGTWLVVLVTSLGNAVLLTVLKGLEDATGGWGVDLPFFGVSFMETSDPATQVLVYAGPFVLAGGIAAIYGLINKRWGANGILTAVLLSVVLPGLLIALVTWQNGWSEIGDWLADQTAGALFALWPTAVAVVCACAGYLIARRASF